MAGWVSKKPEVLDRILKKAIKRIDAEFGLEDDNLNAYIAIDGKNMIAVINTKFLFQQLKYLK